MPILGGLRARCGGSTSAACRSTSWTPTCPPTRSIGHWVTSRLYEANRTMRLAQYAVLGVGGVRALRRAGHPAVGPPPQRGPPRAGRARAGEPGARGRHRTTKRRGRRSVSGSCSRRTRRCRPATRRTTVERGAGRRSAMSPRWPATRRGSWRWGGCTRPTDERAVGMTPLALRVARSSNGVSRRHGEVAREMWRPLFGDVPAVRGADQPRDQRRARADLDGRPDARHCSTATSGRAGGGAPTDDETWAAVDDIPDAELWAARGELRRATVGSGSPTGRIAGPAAAWRAAGVRRARPSTASTPIGSRSASHAGWRPTSGCTCSASSADRSLALLDGERPVQFLFAGKAHPSDDGAKRARPAAVRAEVRAHGVAGRVAFLEDYDLSYRRHAGGRLRRLGQPAAPTARRPAARAA